MTKVKNSQPHSFQGGRGLFAHLSVLESKEYVARVILLLYALCAKTVNLS